MPNTKEKEKLTYLEYKLKVLKGFRLNDTVALREYLEKETEGMPEGEKKEIRLDRLCRDLIMAYYDGDRTYTKPEAAR